MEPIVTIAEHSDYRTWRKGIGFGIRRHPFVWFAGVAIASFWLWQVIWLGRDAYLGDENGAGFIPFLFITTLLFVFLFVVMPRWLYRSNASVTTTCFYEDHFDFSSVRRDVTLSGRKSYDQIRKAYETKDMFYLKCGKDGHFFPRNSLTEDQAAALRALFARKFGDKFKGMK